MKFEFEIFTAGAGDIPVERDAIGDSRHQHLAESSRPGPVIVFRDQPISVSARVRGVVKRSVVDDRPVHELEMAIAADRVEVEEIDCAHLPQAQLQTPYRNGGGERQGIARGLRGFVA
jgi:hypothetical protein